ncbi:Eco57I restriction-modification methylase domain-containing protein [Brachyspira aalborgi]|uniref:site-specific DNA-methyltransferase (adenine-specific) n=1 Tax=Brachyspira aalborgi TaxID=29522 RepID=A0A5C8EFZ4_9SPIR|nr:Eco57I restriction-modification methylase domain-containing protein [Brachyspira aalborgi]TXJ35901.1 type II restriction endonuclease [Brachyspira aalborgi]
MSKDFFRFDKEYSREEWTKYLGDNFKYEYGSIPNQNSIIEKYIDCLDDSNNKAIVWLGNLNVDEDIGVYEIRIKNTKTGSRVKISKICTDIIKSGNRNSFGKGIFFILYSNENEKAYRISYVKYDKKVNENFEVKKDLSDPKRFTYLLGEGAKVKTAQSRLNKEAFSSVKKIEEAFSVEPVNKEFYKGIKISFDKIYKNVLKNFENENSASDRLLSAKEFSLRFLGRALFCWFLREKDLIPKEIFDFINIDETKTKDNYYKEVLEELFFNILNVKMEERKIESKIINKYEKQIPFLNGGLFLKKEEDYKVKTIDNEIIKELFEFFEKYNFTVDESAPFDIEISIDPEMLGRIFENLLAEINPESSASARKETGSFYTPREIVDYMVCESIKLYLYKKTQNVKADKIDNIFSVNEEADFSNEERNEILNAIHEMKILDIACGSGAFPMGILNRVFNIIDKLDSNHEFYKEFLLKNIKGQAREEFKKLYQANKFNYAYKLDMLQRMIHGVDIQPIAIEISRLRAFLSLIVDEEKESGQDNLGIKALPNLEFNFISANSLISLEHKEKEQKEFSDETTEGIIKRMRNIADGYFNADTVEKKIRIKTEFESLMGGIENNSRDILELDAEDKKKFLSWNPFENKSTDFFDSEIQFGTKFFDIVIGNPPYGAKISAEDKKYFKENYKYANQGSLDTYKIFIEKGFNLLDKNGNLNFIVPISITSSKSNIELHKMILDNCEFVKVSSYSNAPSRIFYNADQRVSIINFMKTNTKTKILLTTKINKKLSSQSIDSVIKNMSFVNSLDFVQPEAFCKIGLPIEKSIMQKLYSQKQTIKDLMGGKQKVYYRSTGGRYYDLYTSYSTKSNKEKSFEIYNSKSIVAILSSTLFYWFRNSYSNHRDSYIREFEIFPIPNFSKEIINKLEKLGKEYETDIEKNHDYSNGVKTYKIRKSKHIIDKIDRLICPLYGLTEEEMEFIIGYELEFRV